MRGAVIKVNNVAQHGLILDIFDDIHVVDGTVLSSESKVTVKSLKHTKLPTASPSQKSYL